MKIAIDELRNKAVKTFTDKEFDREVAEQVVDCLLWADMSGIHTMGIAKMTGSEPMQNIKPKGEITVERETKLSQMIDAASWPALVVSEQATKVAIQKAHEHGLAIVGVRNTFSTNGALAYYVEQIAKQDLIGIALTSTLGSVAPFNSADPLFGTNPIAFSFPTNGDPLTFDMSFSAIPWASMLLAKARGEQLPENTAIDSEGNPTTDPNKVPSGALLPFDLTAKGSGIGMVVEVLGGCLTNAVYTDPTSFDKDWGNLFLAIDPNLLIDLAAFKKNNSDMIKRLKDSRKRGGETETRLPGERSRAAHEEAVRSGMVEIDDTVLRELGYI